MLYTDIQTGDQHLHQHYSAGVKKIGEQFLFDGAIMKEGDGQKAGKVDQNEGDSIWKNSAAADNEDNMSKKNKQISL